MTAAILLAAGSSTRFGGSKLESDLGGLPVWAKSALAFFEHPLVDEVGLVATPEILAAAAFWRSDWLFLVEGGASRQSSAWNGISLTDDHHDILLIHDAARPWVSGDVIARVIEGVRRSRAAFPCLPVTDTIKLIEENEVKTLNRSLLAAVQTPQGAERGLMIEAHLQATGEATDDMALIEQLGVRPEPVPGDPANLKITYRGDELRSSQGAPPMETRTGIGYDIHRFSSDPDRPLWLGGVEFDSRPGLEGHSDADALIHAAVDAVLGAASLGDIGQLFPNTDPRYKDMRSSAFLAEAASRVRKEGWRIVHLDCSLAAERPKVMKRATEIRAVLSEALGVSPSRVSIKATTNEGLGSIGRGEGIAALAVATLCRPFDPSEPGPI
jgi:2-C-methyl-D-erythritol 4-phosphate cytidylyltransferase / 2-C-methyl-D-erythritol 2,4-cyclodiphosphate synthase